jgi:hypothetical protein
VSPISIVKILDRTFAVIGLISFLGELDLSEDIDVVRGGVAELVGIEGGVVSGVTNLESSGVEASDWRPRHDEQYHEA